MCLNPSVEPRTAGVGEGVSSPPAGGKDSAFLRWNLKEVMCYTGRGVAPLIARSKCFSECTITHSLQIHSFPALKTSFIPSSASRYDSLVLQNCENSMRVCIWESTNAWRPYNLIFNKINCTLIPGFLQEQAHLVAMHVLVIPGDDVFVHCDDFCLQNCMWKDVAIRTERVSC